MFPQTNEIMNLFSKQLNIRVEGTRARTNLQSLVRNKPHKLTVMLPTIFVTAQIRRLSLCSRAVDGDKKKLMPFIVRAGSSFHNRGGYQARVNKVHTLYYYDNFPFIMEKLVLDSVELKKVIEEALSSGNTNRGCLCL